ncbi:hypothetical protein [Actinacidiphila sp. bgisy160]|uniref:hypothetical protein n=1 Tax=Actinacidiphila sp. bgisy160 TaxID=3413796 RepID=UPI003D732463
MLLRLVFAKGRPIKAESLKGMLPRSREDNSVEQAVRQARAVLQRHGVTLPKQNGGSYRLEQGTVRLDALEFPDQVEALPADPEAEQVSALLRLWRGDPRSLHALDKRHWSEAYRARDRLIGEVERLFHEGVEVDGWLDFAGNFPSDPEIMRVDALDPARVPVRRRRLLIVEDNEIMGPELVRLFEEKGYEARLVTSTAGYHSEIRQNTFDGALVDRHLTPDNDDSDGFLVLDDLRVRGVPRVLLTAFLPPGNIKERIKELTEEYGLSGICFKDDPRQVRGHFRRDTLRVVDQMIRPV